MARSRRKHIGYDSPGLFDLDNGDYRQVPLTEKPRVLAAGGVTLTDEESDEEFESPLGKLAAPNDSKRLRFMSFGSGSSGNCSFIGNENGGILLDAGVDADHVEADLRRHNIKMGDVWGILLTHDHTDHLKYVYTLLRRNRHLCLYCTPRTLNGILRRSSISRRVRDYHKPIFKETPFMLGDFKITPFEVHHDGTDNVGFCIDWEHHHFVAATDLGDVSERAYHYIKEATTLMIESNYDREMLVKGHYPEYLKARIIAGNGHLDNEDTAALLKDVWNEKLTYIFLCHLSKENNTPPKALKCSREALLEAGAAKVGDGTQTLFTRDAPVQLVALPRYESTMLYYIK